MSCLQVPAAPAFNPYPRLVQVGEFEVATDGGIWVAIRDLGRQAGVKNALQRLISRLGWAQ
jgi:hypothetical protein